MAQALSANGSVYSWGSNGSGQLGLDSNTEAFFEPRVIRELRGVRIKQVLAGDKHSLALDENGNVYSWGCSADGKLGLGDSVRHLIACL